MESFPPSASQIGVSMLELTTKGPDLNSSFWDGRELELASTPLDRVSSSPLPATTDCDRLPESSSLADFSLHPVVPHNRRTFITQTALSVLQQHIGVLALKLFANANVLCRTVPANEAPRPAEQMPHAIAEHYAIPNFNLLSLSAPHTLEHANYKHGRIQIGSEVFAFDLLLPSRSKEPAPFILMLPVTEDGEELIREISLRFTEGGFATGRLSRRKDIFKRNESPQELENDLRQAIRVQRAFLSMVSEQPEIDSQQIGLVGLSLGGIMGASLAAVDQRIGAAVIAVAGADIPGIIETSSLQLIKSWIDSRSSSTGQTTEELLSELRMTIKTDPLELAGYVETDKILMVSALNDSVVPDKFADLLWHELGRPERSYVPFGHFGAGLMLEWIGQHTARFLKHKLYDRQ